MRSKANKPFPSSPGPLFQNEGRCSAFDMEIIFHSHANKTHFHKKGCAPSLILKVRVFGTRKWPIDNVPPWYSLVQSKSLYESEDVQAFWDIPVFAEYNEVRAKRVDARIVDHQAKTVTTLEMSCPWIQDREKKYKLYKKVQKFGPLCWETA